MDDFNPNYNKQQSKAREEGRKSMWTLSYRIKGMTLGTVLMFGYGYFYLDKVDAKMVIAGGILGYFLGWVVGSFFYTKK